MSVEQKQKTEFVYKPEGAAEKAWPFNLARMSNKESTLIEELTGWDFLDFQDHLFGGSAKARHALLWTYLRREHTDLDPDSVEFMWEEVVLRPVVTVPPPAEPVEEPGPVLGEADEEGKGESGPDSVSVPDPGPVPPDL